jgi:hypothetical protein
MCNCIKETTNRVLNHLREQCKDKAIIGDFGTMCVTSISFPPTDRASWYQSGQELEYQYTPIKKDGSLGKEINKRISLIHRFCPFCGEKYPE